MPDVYHFGLIGDPIGHSFSPLLHQAALAASGLAGDYRLFSVVDLPQGDQRLRKVIEKIRFGELDGVNITIPHKQNVIPLLDTLSSTAEAVGAVNTVFLKDGILHGDNTDVAGFMNDLRRVGIKNLENHLAVVLGAGGAARAVVWGLLTGGWRVIILARQSERAQQMADWTRINCQLNDTMDAKRISTGQLIEQSIRELIANESVDLIVNTTPLGMTSHPRGIAWPETIAIPKTASVYDLVYTPPITELIHRARQRGIPAFNGLGMLVEQAALAFEIWTGLPASRDAMWKAVQNPEEKS